MRYIRTSSGPAIACLLCLFFCATLHAQDTLVLRDDTWGATAHAGMKELQIPSAGSLLQGFIYQPNGAGKHPTLLLLHGFPGNERNLDLAQVVRAHGWNVIYFDYRGSWGSQGSFSFMHCVEDVVNAVAFCKANAASLGIDTAHIALFGHSMGGWICLKALQELRGVEKGFALSAWNIGRDFKTVHDKAGVADVIKKRGYEYFVLNTAPETFFQPVIDHNEAYDLANDAQRLGRKQIVMLDEHNHNADAANAIRSANKNYFDYAVWNTDHPFSNKRVSLMKRLLAFLDR